ncbi:MAG: hypothetical protein HKL95_03635, partial [Phycisphaerae bacterium]|nr:hypothetical protein [Phycisphaerae bacterium]
LSMRLVASSPAAAGQIPLRQIGPGEYQATIKLAGPEAVAATVTERQFGRNIFIGMLNGPALAGPYFPATAHVYRCPWKNVRWINVAGSHQRDIAGVKWQPRRKDAPLSLAPLLLWIGIIVMLAVLWAGQVKLPYRR